MWVELVFFFRPHLLHPVALQAGVDRVRNSRGERSANYYTLVLIFTCHMIQENVSLFFFSFNSPRVALSGDVPEALRPQPPASAGGAEHGQLHQLGKSKRLKFLLCGKMLFLYKVLKITITSACIPCSPQASRAFLTTCSQSEPTLL